MSILLAVLFVSQASPSVLQSEGDTLVTAFRDMRIEGQLFGCVATARVHVNHPLNDSRTAVLLTIETGVTRHEDVLLPSIQYRLEQYDADTRSSEPLPMSAAYLIDNEGSGTFDSQIYEECDESGCFAKFGLEDIISVVHAWDGNGTIRGGFSVPNREWDYHYEIDGRNVENDQLEFSEFQSCLYEISE